ncbi:MAG: methenyltetrahydromethanopterin cyclohydrolase [Parvibaculaceae bacterium]
MTTGLSVNANAATLVDALLRDADRLRISASTGPKGERLIDLGARALGSIEAGLRLSEICMGGLGRARLSAQGGGRWPWSIEVSAARPKIACLASQYAGWNLSHGEGKGAYVAMGSGPARALARKEKLFEQLDYRDTAETATIVLEAAGPPPVEIVDKLAHDCGVKHAALNILYAPTRSLAGGVQVVARVLEVALHAAHETSFPLDRIVDGMGVAPLSPPHPDFVTALGRTNDAIIYGGRVHLFVTGPADDARALAASLPSLSSRDYGHPFAAIFKRFNGDFYAIDPKLFSPAEVIVSAIDAGETFHGGSVNWDVLDASFA